MDLQGLIDLYRHMEWADATVWASVLTCGSAHADPKLKETLYHIHLVQHAFLRTWRSEPRDTPFLACETLREVMDWGRTYHGEVAGHLQTFSADALLRPMPLAWADMVERAIGRAPTVTTLRDTILQVPLHSQYHRGQVNARLRDVGGTPPLVDYIAWVWFGRPGAEWPLQ